jgi:2-aminoadipate transaminase
MVEISHTAGLDEAALRWQEQGVLLSLLAEGALAVGAGSPTDAGVAWTMPPVHPDPIELAGGIPDPAALPATDLRESFDRVLTSTPAETLRYGGVQGFDGLRAALTERQSRVEGIPMEPGNFLIGNGSAGSISTICDAVLDPGDVVIVERPSFSGTLRTIRGHRPEIVPVPLDEQGVRVDKIAEAIERAEAEGKRVKLVYTIPDFHNPTGTTMSTERKVELIRLCADHHTLIVEDAAYAEIFFGAQAPPSLYAMAGGQGVLKAATFSKVIATGLRIGWVQGQVDYINALINVRFDMGNSPLLQRAIADYMESGKLDAHIREMRPLYARKCETLCRSLEEHCGPYVRFQRPEGGFFLWVECIGVSAQDVVREAAQEGLIFPVGSLFFLDGERDDTKHIRLAFVTATLEQLEEVGPRLSRAFQRALGER